ncbi:AIM24 family protein [Paenibacillus arenilitoris]|uniref:AIM24 family protein n=1 Tax=Paenibacillus arenilitoris TaxID=2772299 RepID=A0A927CL67_9BACL|nr:AIM24 family protein [Paenibacillus arenilitoris]MBD2867896.1 AIM24 family protein [Paenibacillus arenilitoris]
MNITVPVQTGHVHVALEEADKLHVLHPKSIIAYQGEPLSREDRFMDLAGMYRKRRWIRSLLTGPSEFILGLPAGCTLETVDIGEQSDLLFDFRHVIFFSEGMRLKPVIQKLKNVWITKELVRMRFSGPGRLGLITAGDMKAIQLHPDRPLYVETGALVAYPEHATIRLSVYGNKLASQHMNVQWEIRGRGPVLIQTGSRDAELEEQLQSGGFVKRILRELLPFGGIYIK